MQSPITAPQRDEEPFALPLPNLHDHGILGQRVPPHQDTDQPLAPHWPELANEVLALPARRRIPIWGIRKKL